MMSHDKSHDGCVKMVHRLCSSCISSVQEVEEDSIKFFLSTWTWSRFKSSWLEPYNFGQLETYLNIYWHLLILVILYSLAGYLC